MRYGIPGAALHLPHRGHLVEAGCVRRYAEGVAAANLAQVFPVPEIAQDTGLREPEFGPLDPDVLVTLSEIEYAQVLGAGIRAVGDPDSLRAAGKELAAVRALLIHGQHLVVGDQRGGVFVVARQVAPEDARGLSDAPETHYGALFRRGKPGAAIGSALRHDSDAAQRQHIAIGPCAGAADAAPDADQGEVLVKQAPLIPVVVGDAPHVRVLAQELDILRARGPG